MGLISIEIAEFLEWEAIHLSIMLAEIYTAALRANEYLANQVWEL